MYYKNAGCNCTSVYDGMQSLLNTNYIGREIKYFDTIDSTNDAARKMAYNGCHEGLVVAADFQTAGRGRLGRRWVTPPKTSIAFSLVLRPNISPKDVSGITLVMGMAVCIAIKNIATVDVGIKWPNDIIINRKKVCGILTEMNSNVDNVNYVIVGVGINVNVENFTDGLKDIATSIFIETGLKLSREHVLAAVLNEFESLYDRFKSSGLAAIIKEYKAYSKTLGSLVKVQSVDEEYEGVAVDITDEGLLVVRLQDGSERLVISGDVSVRGILGYAE